jgi:hypothetical protein
VFVHHPVLLDYLLVEEPEAKVDEFLVMAVEQVADYFLIALVEGTVVADFQQQDVVHIFLKIALLDL